MAGTFRIGRILGVPVGVHWSLLGIGLLLTLTMATGNPPVAQPGHESRVYWTVGVATTAGCFATVLAHGSAAPSPPAAMAWASGTICVILGGRPPGDEAPTPVAHRGRRAAVSVALTVAFAVIAPVLRVPALRDWPRRRSSW
jgi:hypothetical protein